VMARRYDSRTTIFSPEGRLYQVEYAMEAINHAGAAVGILASDGIVLAAEKKVHSKLLEPNPATRTEKMYKLDNHLAAAVAGITADANILINYARLSAQRYLFQYQDQMPVEQLVQYVCDLKQGYTQYGGLRPFGVSFLYAGWDGHYGFQLYQSDPSGNYGGWKATAIGANNQAALSILRQDYAAPTTTTTTTTTTTPSTTSSSTTTFIPTSTPSPPSLRDALRLAVKVLSKTIDSTALNAEKLEFATLTRTPTGKTVFHIFSDEEIETLVKSCDLAVREQDEDIPPAPVPTSYLP